MGVEEWGGKWEAVKRCKIIFFCIRKVLKISVKYATLRCKNRQNNYTLNK